MICPYCGNICPDSARVCPECGQSLLTVPQPAASKGDTGARVRHIAFICACWIVSLIVTGVFIYKVYFWIDTYRINRVYQRGNRAPSVNEIVLADGRAGHSITFFADSGDQIFIPELDRSYTVSGGFARIELADSTWFRGDLTNVESAVVTLSPLLIRENGDMTRLPHLRLEVDAPQSPLTVLNPSEDGQEVNTAIFPLQLQVVPGSALYINGNDVSDIVDRAGLLTYNLNVYPVGNNTISVLVRTPNHKEKRQDIIVYRPEMEIDLELSINTLNESSTKTMTVSGKTEIGANIEVDSSYVPESLMVDPETGDFKFLAKFSIIGENTVAFRAVKEGKKDSVIRFQVNYLPDEDEYTRTAWAMDYNQLRRLFEQWKGTPFKCVGPVIDVYQENGQEYFVMDVGTDGFQQLVVLINYSGRTDIRAGEDFSAYADVQGRTLFNGAYYPLLNARYVYKRAN